MSPWVGSSFKPPLLSLKMSTFPTSCKLSVISPIPKYGDPTAPGRLLSPWLIKQFFTKLPASRAVRKVGFLISPRHFFTPVHLLYKAGIRPAFEYCNHTRDRASSTSFVSLDRIRRQSDQSTLFNQHLCSHQPIVGQLLRRLFSIVITLACVHQSISQPLLFL